MANFNWWRRSSEKADRQETVSASQTNVTINIGGPDQIEQTDLEAGRHMMGNPQLTNAADEVAKGVGAATRHLGRALDWLRRKRTCVVALDAAWARMAEQF